MKGPDKTERMVASRRADADARAVSVRTVLTQMVAVGEVWDVTTVAAKAGVSRGLLYRRPELRAEYEAAVGRSQEAFARGLADSARVSSASLRVDLENSRAQVRRLEAQVRALESRLGTAIAKDVADELASGGDVARLRARVVELEGSLTSARAALAERDEDLEAARKVNRELMAQLNQPGG